ncbi:uncharacterized protein EI90DRAFT_3251210 [Cantharellus anzutake]|uniref:uncharacterized protein n=1 Tax=Cantharellus anzutake TaxID=1750568 RepID=UPI0019044852|nr:uncharacterized protein EI90DRAFT_3251210 [Cantharellus anzutake]KAF8337962.1 hypothetical protein EI90DRAFT_3251210 [Cantharellus anzutake]
MSVEDALEQLDKEQELAVRTNLLTCTKEVARIRKTHLHAQEVAQQQATRVALAQRREVEKAVNEAKRQAAKAERERKKQDKQLRRAMIKAAKDAAKAAEKAARIVTRTKNPARNLSRNMRGSKRKRASNDKENTPETSPKRPWTRDAPPEELPVNPPPQHRHIFPTPQGLAAVQMGYGNPNPVVDEDGVEYMYGNTPAIFPGPPPPVVHRKGNSQISNEELEAAEVLAWGF